MASNKEETWFILTRYQHAPARQLQQRPACDGFGARPGRIQADVHGEHFPGGGVRGQDSRPAIRSDFLWCAHNYPEGDATREERGE